MKEFQVRLEQIGGCGDGGCMIHVRPGMHTNGGCRCSTNPFKMRQTVHAYKGAVAEQAQEIERLTGCLAKANANHEHFEREWYLSGDQIATLTAENERLRRSISLQIAFHEDLIAADLSDMAADAVTVGMVFQTSSRNHIVRLKAALQPKEGNQ